MYRFVELYNKFEDPYSRRKIVLSLGRAQQEHWFRSKKRYLFDFNTLLKRAIIAAEVVYLLMKESIGINP
ncbi:hypothetical protein QO179_07600 [Bacillus stercoris]|nr:hypothetical protein [Bacillus stercoris]